MIAIILEASKLLLLLALILLTKNGFVEASIALIILALEPVVKAVIAHVKHVGRLVTIIGDLAETLTYERLMLLWLVSSRLKLIRAIIIAKLRLVLRLKSGSIC